MTDSILSAGLGPVRSTRWAARCGIAAAVLALLGTWGSGFGLWPFTVGFLFLAAALVLSLIALVAGAYALLKGRGSNVPRGGLMLGMLGALGFLGWLGSWISAGSSVPMIHDITTDTANPPAFAKLELRKDNLIGLKSIDEWRQLHAKAYGDIKPVTLAVPPVQAIAKAEALIKARGWDIALVTADRIEATETVSAFRFKDDVVITAAPSADGKSSIINIRSVSRVGQSDLGVNGARVRALLQDMTTG
jgi:uncharacterized protein (DUF1499 family)